MLFRLRALVIPSFLFAAACSGDLPSTTPGDPGAPGAPGGSDEGQTVTPTDQKATGLGMSIVSSDAAGVPRLIRAVVPRAVPAGMAPGAAALEHVAALKELWVGQGQTTDLVERSTQLLRNGAAVVTLAQEVDGFPVNRGEMHVLLHTDGRLAAVSGTLLASAAKPRFVSTPGEALGHALDKQYGAARPQPAITEDAAAAADADGWQTLTVASTPDLQVVPARAASSPRSATASRLCGGSRSRGPAPLIRCSTRRRSMRTSIWCPTTAARSSAIRTWCRTTRSCIGPTRRPPEIAGRSTGRSMGSRRIRRVCRTVRCPG
jgi:hypothetical protein